MPFDKIDFEIAEAQKRLRSLLLIPVSQRDAHARGQLSRSKRLCDIIVGSKVKRHDLAFFVIREGKNDDRQGRNPAQLLDHDEPVLIGKPEFENYQIELFR